MRILVTGSAGQLGRIVSARMSAAGHEVRGVDLPEVDITRPDAIARVASDLRPEVIVNCAAFTDVDGAEDRPLIALEVNALAVRSLAQLAREHEAVLVHYSTDFVFDGDPSRAEPYTEEDRPDPRSVYAATKLLSEWLAAATPRHYVFRVESLYGGLPPRSGVDRIIQNLSAGREARVFEDRVVTASYAVDVVEATVAALDRAVPFGLYHCVNEGVTTWVGVGRQIAALGGFDPGLVVPIKVADVTMKASRPQFCALSGAKLAATGIVMPTWQDALARYVARVAQPVSGAVRAGS